MENIILLVKNLTAGYHNMAVVHDISFQVQQGEIVALLGGNGAGKSTILWTILGKNKMMEGQVWFNGQSLVGKKMHEMISLGISMVPEGRLLFPKLTVLDNLMMGAFTKKDKKQVANQLEKVLNIFPAIEKHLDKMALNLSGGEQQMVAIARGLMCDPKLLILDEPTLGLSPKIVQEVFQLIQNIHNSGTTVILVEQNALKTLEIVHHAYLISDGRIVLSGTGDDLLKNDYLKKVYLGV